MPDIYQEAGLPLWLRPYEVIVTSAYTALIETIPDTVVISTSLVDAVWFSAFLKYLIVPWFLHFTVGIDSFNQK
jgi:hypothetical protein